MIRGLKKFVIVLHTGHDEEERVKRKKNVNSIVITISIVLP